MIEAVTIAPIDVLHMELEQIFYSALPLIIILAGASAVVYSIRTEPWGISWYPPGTFLGITLMVLGVFLAVTQ